MHKSGAGQSLERSWEGKEREEKGDQNYIISFQINATVILFSLIIEIVGNFSSNSLRRLILFEWEVDINKERRKKKRKKGYTNTEHYCKTFEWEGFYDVGFDKFETQASELESRAET